MEITDLLRKVIATEVQPVAPGDTDERHYLIVSPQQLQDLEDRIVARIIKALQDTQP